MKIGGNFTAFNYSASGMRIQRERMNLITENIANSGTTKTDEGKPYQRKMLVVSSEQKFSVPNTFTIEGKTLKLNTSSSNHISLNTNTVNQTNKKEDNIKTEVSNDSRTGDLVYMPEHPDANKDGYVEMPNVNVVTEMVDMITATRTFEANLTAFNAAKQMAKDALDM